MVKLRFEQRKAWWRKARWWGMLCGIYALVHASLVPWSLQPRWYHESLRPAVRLVSQGVAWAQDEVQAWWRSPAGALHYEIAKLRAENRSLQIALQESSQAHEQLQQLTQWEARHPLDARVVQRILTAPHHTCVINVGRADGVALGDPVMTTAGVLGRVEQLGEHDAKILLLTDPHHVIDVTIQRTRARGLLRGTGRGVALGRQVGVSRLEYVTHNSGIQAGDTVVSSGLDGRYPAGLAVGTIRAVQFAEDQVFHSAEVVPFAEWQNAEWVRVLRQESDS